MDYNLLIDRMQYKSILLQLWRISQILFDQNIKYCWVYFTRKLYFKAANKLLTHSRCIEINFAEMFANFAREIPSQIPMAKH